MAAELDILFRIIPIHLRNAQYSMDVIFEEGKQARKLCLMLLDGLYPKAGQSCSTEVMEQIEDYFQVSAHQSPGMKVVLRFDWLLPTDYQRSVSKPHQFEMREEVFVQKAIAHLGRNLVQCMMGIINRKVQAHATAPFNSRIGLVLEGITLGQEVLNVSASSP